VTTRREIVRASAGLAAIIAAGKAPAALVKSMLGMRGAITPGAKSNAYEVEWIEGDGVAYIDTGVKQGNNTVTVKYQQLRYVYDSVVFGIFCLQSGNHVDYLGYFPNVNRFGLGQGASYYNLANGNPDAHFGENWHTAVLDRRNGLTMDGVYVGSVTNNVDFSSDITYGVFRRQGAYWGVTNPAMRLQSISIRSRVTGKMLFDARAMSVDGVGCLYDKVSKQFFGDASGTGVFSVGPRKVA